MCREIKAFVHNEAIKQSSGAKSFESVQKVEKYNLRAHVDTHGDGGGGSIYCFLAG